MVCKSNKILSQLEYGSEDSSCTLYPCHSFVENDTPIPESSTSEKINKTQAPKVEEDI